LSTATKSRRRLFVGFDFDPSMDEPLGVFEDGRPNKNKKKNKNNNKRSRDMRSVPNMR